MEDEVICSCIIAGTPATKGLWGRLKDVFDPTPKQFLVNIKARKSEDPDYLWVTTVEKEQNATVSASMIPGPSLTERLRKEKEKS